MNESEYQALVEAGWRRPLTSEEQARIDAWLVARPELQGDLESDAALTHHLGKLPDAPLASNFTAQVLQALDREGAAKLRPSSSFGQFRRWFQSPASRVAWALLLVGTGWFGYSEHQANVREEVTQGVSVLAKVATLSDPAVLQDFEAIQRLGQTAPRDDEELFAVLNQ